MNQALDMSQFIEAKSDQLNADDLIGRNMTITVTRVAGSDGDQPVSIYFEGDNGKPFKPCKTIRRVLVSVWGRYANDYIGRAMTLYRDDTVQFGGLQVGGIRISHMSHIDKETVVVVAKSKGKKAGMKILPLADAPKQQTAGKDAAREWADKFITNVGRAPSAEQLENYFKGKARMFDSLAQERPELHTECEAALSAKRASFAPVDDVEDEDPFADDTPSWTAYVASLDKRIAAATTAEELDEIEALLTGSEGIPEAEVATLDGAIAKKRRALA